MEEIKICLSPRLRHESEYLLRRTAEIIVGHDSAGELQLHRQEHGGYDFCMGTSNDWKTEIRGDQLIVAYRYGGGNPDLMLATGYFLTWQLGCREFEIEKLRYTVRV